MNKEKNLQAAELIDAGKYNEFHAMIDDNEFLCDKIL